MTHDALFERFSARLKAQVGPEVYASWFARLKLHSVSKSVVRFTVPTTFLKSWINNRYMDLITNLVQSEDPDVLKVEILVRSASRPVRPAQTEERAQPAQEIGAAPRNKSFIPSQPASAPAAQPAAAQATLRQGGSGPLFGSPLDTRFTFDTFVEGSSNRVALAAAKTIAEAGAGAVRFNPLFIHAGVGLGKTHLLQAIANAAIDSPRNPRVVYLTAEYFMWRFATAIRDNDALTLKDTLRNIDLLVIDDMQFLQGKMIQHEFCHLLNMLLDSAKQVVVAADRAPWELESLDPRVRSRLQGGMAIEIEGPDYDMRYEMLNRRLGSARQDDPSFEISDEILTHVAKSVTASGRELEGAFNQLMFRRSFEPNLSVDRVDELLSHLVGTGEAKRVRIEDIQRIVAKHYNVSRQELVSNRRTRVIVKPRQIAMYLAKMLTPRSFPEIGRRFGGRDHTTVLHAVRKIEELISGDTKLGHEVELLKRLINENNA
ncbi:MULTISPECIES: chromosomal replication initiator protein DnaA [unclassified Agrobacterium]|uniref:chromosomal replication initiator protein DnaA n=1 Tax=unclassified Agrobacterium TaxID=2632611 RepID=UPI00244B5217|nr:MULTISPECIES: chromosomal replication initiator protein DnaA [unclassified Agrobacterium]MDH0612992.1 chromosomal replication initiator protein DnaA [Agrobacterium sp. GD03872]MDH0694857.1 chromosomal replication initiator protein DnaA [Agrobacterium sp. GD03871]MDH1057745.1 chromosomal replication initiator protein DnaA [Agrobacterium sp. GD03992]MDH2209034.1 chromosomal replication initiator protein DnaA [Agrobacterium sp. GD03643]MDH2218525.1 chromosomal replication initiator protein Dna